MDNKIYDVVILGAGPAGLAAGLYAGRSRLSVLILEKGIDGGQIAVTHDIENYPGQSKVDGMTGQELVAPMTEQCKSSAVSVSVTPSPPATSAAP
ncbi:MAG: FAD-dependent oxidoreductase [Oscillospiraceae bacterium]